MKNIIELHKALQDNSFMKVQFMSNSKNRNVLFLTVKTTGKNLYRYLLPYFVMREQELPESTGLSTWECAITGMEKFNKERPLVNNTSSFLNSSMILWADIIVVPFTIQPLENIIKQWRMINPNIKVYYNIDFDYTDLPKDHLYKEIFEVNDVTKAVNINTIISDKVFTTNAKMAEHLTDYINNLLRDEKSPYRKHEVRCTVQPLPMFIDPEIVLENIENNQIEKVNSDKFRIGIVCSEHTHSDIEAYKKEMFTLSKEHNVQFVLFGYDGIKDGKKCYLDGTDVEYVKPCSIVHYFKQLQSLSLSAMFLPLKKITYNERSESYNRLLESWLMEIPVIAPDMFPYNEIIVPNKSGFIFQKKAQIIDYVSFIKENPDEIKKLTENASKVLEHTFCFNEANVLYLNEIYS
jgi:uncharacterized UPF0146 family protein